MKLRLQPYERAWIVAGAALLGAGGVAALGNPGGAIALGVAGAGTLLLGTEQGVGKGRAVESAFGPLRSLAQIVRSLSLEGTSILVPTSSKEGSTLNAPRLFIPARGGPITRREIPPLSEEITLHRDRPGAVGLSLPPPGLDLYRSWRTKGALSVEEAGWRVREALEGLDLARRVRVQRRADGGSFRIEYTHLLFGDLCRWTHSEGSPWNLQGMCPVCSLSQIVLSEGLKAPLRVARSSLVGERASLELEVVPSSGN